MTRKALSLFLSLALSGWAGVLQAQSPIFDPDVAKGIRQVEEGDLDAAILTLDNAARRLATDPSRAKELSQAYLYLGIAYFGKGHEAAAKAKFREAVAQIKDLSLSPEKFPPKVIDLFEAAKEEAGRTAAVQATPAPPPRKKARSKKRLVIAGVVIAAVAGGAAAGGGGGGDGETAITENFTGSLSIDEFCRAFRIIVGGIGALEATVTWTEPNVVLAMDLYDNPNQEGDPVAGSNRTSNSSARLSFAVTPRTYSVAVCHSENSCSNGGSASLPPCSGTFNLTVRHP